MPTARKRSSAPARICFSAETPYLTTILVTTHNTTEIVNIAEVIRLILEPLSASELETLAQLLHKKLSSKKITDLERCTLCRLCDNSVCANCPIPADLRDSRTDLLELAAL